MSLLVFVLGSAAILIAGYLGYGRLLSRLLDLDNRRPTPAVELRDDVDFEPTSAPFLMGQHFSAIAAAGPIVGPILAGLASVGSQRCFGFLSGASLSVVFMT